jgi:hypothetical protein
MASHFWFEAQAPTPQSPVLEFRWLDFVYYLVVVLLSLLIMISIGVARLRKRKKRITLKNICADLGEVKDDPNEPARWVP